MIDVGTVCLALISADIIISAAGTAALWRKMDLVNTRLVQLETEHKIYTAGEPRGHA